MTHEWHPVDETGTSREEREMEDFVEQRLKFYYGPELPEQPLPESSWQQVFSKLAAQQQRSPQRRKLHVGLRFRSRFQRQQWWEQVSPGNQPTPPLHAKTSPADAQEAFARILCDAHMSQATPMLACRFTNTRIRPYKAQTPDIRVSLLRKRPLRLTLPTHTDIKPIELDVLLAGGLARYEEIRRPGSLLVYTLLMSTMAGLFTWVIAALFLQRLSLFTRFFEVLACTLLIGAILRLLNMHARMLAKRADTTMVSWIGRFRACQGLHALADRSRVPSRRRWGELSLTERIAHICGSHVDIQVERLTLVR